MGAKNDELSDRVVLIYMFFSRGAAECGVHLVQNLRILQALGQGQKATSCLTAWS